jgi:hypothetical protein
VPSRSWLRSRNLTGRWRRVAGALEEFCGPGCEGDAMLLEPTAGVIAELFAGRVAPS